MSYFPSNYNRINYPLFSDGTQKGLYNAQLGAIHAIGSHFTLYPEEEALIIMPTGSGKTAVLNLAPYLLRANRVLVISSSVLVRGQIVEEFSTLKTLKASSVFHKDVGTPKVLETKSPIKSIEDWEKIKDFDVIVGIPNSLYSGLKEEIKPSIDVFDLILIDEAHHSAASTWKSILEYFSPSKKILFTATPFRRDKREVVGKIIYNYPLSKAKKDGIFANIGYIPVKKIPAQNPDETLALEAEKCFQEDKQNEFEHFLLVRTDSKTHAKELEKIYQTKTTLNLKKVDSSKTYATIKKIIEKLKKKELDGIICVDMLGEGFDFPNLKIAAIHKPHKSLAVTLQFIGRFARTNTLKIGAAKFLAFTNDIEIGRRKLYEEGVTWDDIIVDLSEGKIIEEDSIKKALSQFDAQKIPFTEESISLYNIAPYCHVKIYRLNDYQFSGNIKIPGHEIINFSKDIEEEIYILVTKELNKPTWLLTDEVVNINYYLFIVYYNPETNLLFINSEYKTNQFYEFLAEHFTSERPERISKENLHKVLYGLTETDFFNIGMLNRTASSGESYKTISGPHAQNVVKKSDGRLYSSGHVFGKAKNADSISVTIGYSSGSKVWSNAYEKIPTFINWCNLIGEKIVSDVEVKTNTGLDNLPLGKRIEKFPKETTVFAATWGSITYQNPPILSIVDADGEIIESVQLLDFDINILSNNENTIELDLVSETRNIQLFYSLENHYYFRKEYDEKFFVFDEYQLLDYLNENQMQFYLTDFSLILNGDLHSADPTELNFDPSYITTLDWNAFNTDITIEYYDPADPDIIKKEYNGNRNSIHETIKETLLKNKPTVLIYDHGTGEIADFITINEVANQIMVSMYHIKSSGGIDPGDRVNDVYEVCGQAIKSVNWTSSRAGFLKKINTRTKNRADKFLKGDQPLVNSILQKLVPIRFEINIVQPGIPKTDLSKKISHILAATDDYIRSNGNNENLIIIASEHK